MLSWFATFTLRLKLIGLAVGGALLTILYFYSRWKIAASAAASAAQKADALEATRELEQRIAERRLELNLRQKAVRDELSKRTTRDALEDQGWGP